MTVRVRFAPSPTGYLHIGGARTALYDYLYAKTKGGKYILRIEDTDAERSRPEYEKSQIETLKWLGIEHDEGPDKGGDFGPYRQSERQDIYHKHANHLIEKGKAYHCFCTEDELMAKKELATKEGRPPHYDGKCRNLTQEEANALLAQGQKASVRFKAPHKAYIFNDLVRSRVVFPEGMVGDFVIMRSNGLPVYNFCCVVDDWLMQISHVIRAEEHLPNTLRQLMIYEALEAKVPEFAHVSLLIGKDRQKLSKRHGATSVTQYQEEGYLPEALVNYLCLLGWSHPEGKDIFTKEELVGLFDIDRFQKAAAMYDIEKLNWVNGQHIKKQSTEDLLTKAREFISPDSLFHQQSSDWQKACLELFKGQIQFYREFQPLVDEIFVTACPHDPGLDEINQLDSTAAIKNYLGQEVKALLAQGQKFVSVSNLDEWTDHIKKDLKVKGKPLFMGMRSALTAKAHGPELKFLLPLVPLEVLSQRLTK